MSILEASKPNTRSRRCELPLRVQDTSMALVRAYVKIPRRTLRRPSIRSRALGASAVNDKALGRAKPENLRGQKKHVAGPTPITSGVTVRGTRGGVRGTDLQTYLDKLLTYSSTGLTH